MNNIPLISLGQAVLGLAGLSKRNIDRRQCLRTLAFAAAKEELGGSVHADILEQRSAKIYKELIRQIPPAEIDQENDNVVYLFSRRDS